ncbi:MAG TPA: PH domain-containing protein [Anaerolineae bacterium]|nr:PH domain-containing protein [Anaerolineae bacterium]
MRNQWELDTRRGWIVGLGIVIVLLATTVMLLVWNVTRPVSIWTFVMGVTAVGALGFAIYLIAQLWGLINASYEMDRNAVVIHWGPIHYQIPMASVRAVFSGAEVKSLRMRFGLRWPGYYVGFGEDKDIGPILFYATRPLAQQVIVRTEGMAYAISPHDLAEFLQAFKERLEMGPTQEIEEVSQHPSFLDWEIWHDRMGMPSLTGSLLWLILLVGLLCWRYPYLPAEIALRFTPNGEPLLRAPASRIFYFALMGVSLWAINGGLGLLLYRRARIAAYFLWGGLLAVLSGLWIAVITVLLRQ